MCNIFSSKKERTSLVIWYDWCGNQKFCTNQAGQIGVVAIYLTIYACQMWGELSWSKFGFFQWEFSICKQNLLQELIASDFPKVPKEKVLWKVLVKIMGEMRGFPWTETLDSYLLGVCNPNCWQNTRYWRQWPTEWENGYYFQVQVHYVHSWPMRFSSWLTSSQQLHAIM